MAVEYQIVYWRDIPAQVRVREAGQRQSRQLAQRFMVAIDEAAMRSGATGAQDYLDDWRTTEWAARDGDLQSAADALVAELEAAYPGATLRDLIKQGGYDRPNQD